MNILPPAPPAVVVVVVVAVVVVVVVAVVVVDVVVVVVVVVVAAAAASVLAVAASSFSEQNWASLAAAHSKEAPTDVVLDFADSKDHRSQTEVLCAVDTSNQNKVAVETSVPAVPIP